MADAISKFLVEPLPLMKDILAGLAVGLVAWIGIVLLTLL